MKDVFLYCLFIIPFIVLFVIYVIRVNKEYKGGDT